MLQGDEWDVFRRYIDMVSGRIGAATFFFEPHNEHRVLISRLVFLADIHLNGQQNIAQLLTFVFSAALAALFASLLVREKNIPLALRVASIALLVALFLSTRQIENFYRGFNSQVPMVAFLTCAAPIALARGRVATAVTLAILATFTMASGLMAWLALAVTALGIRRWRLSAILFALGAIAIVAYSVRGGASHLSIALLKSHAREIFEFFLVLIANPLGLGHTLQQSVSLIVLVLVAWQAVNAIRDAQPEQYALVAICFAVLATAALIAAGRFGFGIAVADSSRYATLMNPLWAALLVLSVRQLVKQPVCFSNAAFAGAAAVAVSLSYIAPQWARPWAENQRVGYDLAAKAIKSGTMEPAALRGAYPDPQRIIDLAPHLRELQLSPFVMTEHR